MTPTATCSKSSRQAGSSQPTRSGYVSTGATTDDSRWIAYSAPSIEAAMLLATADYAALDDAFEQIHVRDGIGGWHRSALPAERAAGKPATAPQVARPWRTRSRPSHRPTRLAAENAQNAPPRRTSPVPPRAGNGWSERKRGGQERMRGVRRGPKPPNSRPKCTNAPPVARGTYSRCAGRVPSDGCCTRGGSGNAGPVAPIVSGDLPRRDAGSHSHRDHAPARPPTPTP